MSSQSADPSAAASNIQQTPSFPSVPAVIIPQQAAPPPSGNGGGINVPQWVMQTLAIVAAIGAGIAAFSSSKNDIDHMKIEISKLQAQTEILPKTFVTQEVFSIHMKNQDERLQRIEGLLERMADQQQSNNSKNDKR